MATRVIKTTDGQLYSGETDEFTDYQDYVEYQNFFTTTKIYKRGMVYDSITRHFMEIFSMGFGLVILLLIVMIVIIPPSTNKSFPVITESSPSPLPPLNPHKRLQYR